MSTSEVPDLLANRSQWRCANGQAIREWRNYIIQIYLPPRYQKLNRDFTPLDYSGAGQYEPCIMIHSKVAWHLNINEPIMTMQVYACLSFEAKKFNEWGEVIDTYDKWNPYTSIRGARRWVRAALNGYDTQDVRIKFQKYPFFQITLDNEEQHIEKHPNTLSEALQYLLHKVVEGTETE